VWSFECGLGVGFGLGNRKYILYRIKIITPIENPHKDSEPDVCVCVYWESKERHIGHVQENLKETSREVGKANFSESQEGRAKRVLTQQGYSMWGSVADWHNTNPVTAASCLSLRAVVYRVWTAILPSEWTVPHHTVCCLDHCAFLRLTFTIHLP